MPFASPFALMFALAVAAALASEVAQAQADTLARIQWRAPPPSACLDPAAVERTIEARLGRRVFTTAPGAVAIDARFSQRDAALAVQLEVHSPGGELLGERELKAESCPQLAASLPVVIAVLLDLDLPSEPAAEPSAPAEPQPPPAAPAPQSPPATPQPAPTASAPAPSLWSLQLGGALLGELRVEPKLAPAAGGAVQLWAALGPLELAGWGQFALESATAGSPAAAVQSLALGLVFCATKALVGDLVGGACGGVGATWLRVRGLDFEQRRSDGRWLGTGRAYVRLAYPVWERLSVRFETGLSLPLARPHYGFEEGGSQVDLYRPSWVWLSAFGFSIPWP